MEALARAMMFDSLITSNKAIENPRLMREVKLLEGKEDCFGNFPKCNVLDCRWRTDCISDGGRQ